MLVVITMCSFPAQSQHLLQQKRNVQHSKELVRNVSTLVITDHCNMLFSQPTLLATCEKLLDGKRFIFALFALLGICERYFMSARWLYFLRLWKKMCGIYEVCWKLTGSNFKASNLLLNISSLSLKL